MKLKRRVSIEELFNAYDKGELTEVFGSGTAAVISPVGTLRYEDREIVINNNEPGKITQNYMTHILVFKVANWKINTDGE